MTWPLTFGSEWGIYIREECILSLAKRIALLVDVTKTGVTRAVLYQNLVGSAFYALYLHEQFHHKNESLGFRLLIATATDRYRPYKWDVYHATFLTPQCLEESLANADCFRRLNERTYRLRLDQEVWRALREYLELSMPYQPPGYAEGVHYLSTAAYDAGLDILQSQVLDAACPPVTPVHRWEIASHMIRALMNIDRRIFMILPTGATPIFRSTWVAPGVTTSSRALESALTRHYGYHRTPGGKGSHVKFKKKGAPTIVLPGNRKSLTPGAIEHALTALGGIPLSRLPEVLEGRVPAAA